jgi:hypothetical protein
VVRVNLDLDTLLTVPDDPPAAGPDRALDPVPSWAAEAGVDPARPTESPITGHITVAATIRPILLLDGNRLTSDRRACLALVSETDRSDRGAADAGVVTPECPVTGGAGIAPEAGRAGRVSGGILRS